MKEEKKLLWQFREETWTHGWGLEGDLGRLGDEAEESSKWGQGSYVDRWTPWQMSSWGRADHLRAPVWPCQQIPVRLESWGWPDRLGRGAVSELTSEANSFHWMIQPPMGSLLRVSHFRELTVLGEVGDRESRDCSNHVFTSAFWCFDIQGLADFEGTAPLVSLEIESNLPTSTVFKYKATLKLSLLWGSQFLGHYLPVLQPRSHVSDKAPVPHSLLKLFKPANPSLTLSFSWKPQ